MGAPDNPAGAVEGESGGEQNQSAVLLALHRAQKAAEDLAIATNTAIIVWENGKIRRITAEELRRERLPPHMIDLTGQPFLDMTRWGGFICIFGRTKEEALDICIQQKCDAIRFFPDPAQAYHLDGKIAVAAGYFFST